MKTTLELPDALFREAKSLAGQKKMTLKRLMTEALEGKILQLKSEAETDPWKKYFGAVSSTPQEKKLFKKTVEENFGQIEEDAWR